MSTFSPLLLQRTHPRAVDEAMAKWASTASLKAGAREWMAAVVRIAGA
jgi:hypothetical protein